MPMVWIPQFEELQVLSLSDGSTGSANPDDVCAMLERVFEYWTESIPGEASYRDWAVDRLGCGVYVPETYDQVVELGKSRMRELTMLEALLKKHELIPNDSPLRKKLGRSFCGFKCAFEMLEREVLGRALSDPNCELRMPAYISAFHISFMYDTEDFSDSQHLQIYLLSCLLRAGYRRMGTECYKEIRVDGVGTHAWEPVMGIEEFVYRHIDKDQHPGVWLMATRGGRVVPDTIQHLSKCYDEDFKILIPNRYLFAFRNGQYDVLDQKYFPPTGSMALDAEQVAVRFFDVEFDPDTLTCARWQDIPTPLLDSVFIHQEFDSDTIDIVYAMLGRMLYPVGKYDQWQVVPFWKGVAGCGKSTVAAMVSNWFPPKFVSTITNNMEDKFGLAAIVDTYVCLCTEVTSKFPLNRGVWQSMVTGEQIPVPRKFRDPLDQKWEVPLGMFGNELPPFDDKSGSVHRRMAIFAMRKTVDPSKADPTIQHRLQADVARLLVKCNRAYRQLCGTYGAQGFWAPNVASVQMHDWHRELLREIDIFSAFMQSGELSSNPLAWVSEADVKDLFRTYLSTMSLNWSEKHHWNFDHLTSVLQRHGSCMVHDQREYPIGTGKTKSQVYMTNLQKRVSDDPVDNGDNLAMVPENI